LVGFDAEHARKRGLSIVMADTITGTMDGNEIILRAHHSVSTSSPITPRRTRGRLGPSPIRHDKGGTTTTIERYRATVGYRGDSSCGT
jgi:hypothetical protein